jgi:GNAT superfamily N-acetyltransferase
MKIRRATPRRPRRHHPHRPPNLAQHVRLRRPRLHRPRTRHLVEPRRHHAKPHRHHRPGRRRQRPPHRHRQPRPARHPPTIWKLYVLPQTQGTGVGTALLHNLFPYAGEKPIRLEYVDGNHRAARFYTANGFTEIGREPAGTPGWPDLIWAERAPKWNARRVTPTSRARCPRPNCEDAFPRGRTGRCPDRSGPAAVHRRSCRPDQDLQQPLEARTQPTWASPSPGSRSGPHPPFGSSARPVGRARVRWLPVSHWP